MEVIFDVSSPLAGSLFRPDSRLSFGYSMAPAGLFLAALLWMIAHHT